MKWHHLTKAEDLTSLVERSHQTPQVIFKHSTRCSISSMAKNRLESADAPDGIDFHYLDLIAYRELSNKIAADFHVHHESPQVLLIHDGECIYDESHMGISMAELTEQAIKK